MTATSLPKTENNSPAAFILDLKADYLRTCDPTEFKFAQRFIPGGYAAWLRVLSTPELEPMIGEWREELAAKMRSEALSRILEAAQGETRDALSANKYIYETLTPKSKEPVGRPSNAKILQKAQEIAQDDLIKQEAYERLFNAHQEKEEEGI